MKVKKNIFKIGLEIFFCFFFQNITNSTKCVDNGVYAYNYDKLWGWRMALMSAAAYSPEPQKCFQNAGNYFGSTDFKVVANVHV